MQTAAILSTHGALIALALLTRGWREPVLYVLAGGWALASTGWLAIACGLERDVYQATVEFGMVLGCMSLWARQGDANMHAWTVGTIGLVVLAWRWLHYVDALPVNQFSYAAATNVVFALQISIAGGWLDDLGAWADNHLNRYFPRRWGLVRNVAAK